MLDMVEEFQKLDQWEKTHKDWEKNKTRSINGVTVFMHKKYYANASVYRIYFNPKLVIEEMQYV